MKIDYDNSIEVNEELLSKTLEDVEKYNFFKPVTRIYDKFIKEITTLRTINDLNLRKVLTEKLLEIYTVAKDNAINGNADSSYVDVYTDAVDEITIDLVKLNKVLGYDDEMSNENGRKL